MKKIYFLIVIFVFTSLILYCQYKLWAYNAYFDSSKKIDYEAFGTYGDFFGGVIGTLFAVIGVIYVYNTYHNQTIFHKKNKLKVGFLSC